jgi:ubiquinone/menaquinone biosynthesis C-methylase UbiE
VDGLSANRGIVRRISNPAQDHVLDVGCGDGAFISFCAEQGAEVTFADIDAEKIASVKRMLSNSNARACYAVVSDANPLPLPDAYADKIIAMEVLEHVDNPPIFLKELVRVGKPGALYLITVPDQLGEKVQQHLAPPGYFEKPNHINIFERSTFEKLIVDAGLVVEKKAYYGFYSTIFWRFSGPAIMISWPPNIPCCSSGQVCGIGC